MQPVIVQTVPLAFALAINPNGFLSTAFATASAASVEWRVSGATPTDSFGLAAIDLRSPTLAESALSIMALSRSALTESRSLTDWERQDADEFFWMQFE